MIFLNYLRYGGVILPFFPYLCAALSTYNNLKTTQTLIQKKSMIVE